MALFFSDAMRKFTIEDILFWADQHHQRTGEWPKILSGLVQGGPCGTTWQHLDAALRRGLRGLPGGQGLPRLLREQRGVPDGRGRPRGKLKPRTSPEPQLTGNAARRLSEAMILAWADAHFQREGRWPQVNSGPIAGTEGETWRNIQAVLRHGCRGLPGGQSLFQLLHQQRGVPERRGRVRYERKCQQAAELRGQGLTLMEIGRRMGGISGQAVQQLLDHPPRTKR